MIDGHCSFIVFIVVYLLQAVSWVALELLNRAHVKAEGHKVPLPFKDILDESKLKEMKAYTLENSAFSMVHKLIVDSVLLAIIASGTINYFDILSDRAQGSFVWSGLAFFCAIGAFLFLLELPFDYYHTFVIEQKHGFNRSDLRVWIRDNLRVAAVSAVILFVLAGSLLWTISAFPHYWWFWGFVIVSGVQFVLIVLYPILIAPLFNKFEPLPDEELAQSVEKLVKEVGMKTDGIFQMDAGTRSAHSNAYFTGVGKTKRIVLFDTLISAHSREEILAVLAHELGHFKLKHVVKSYAFSLGASFAGFYLSYLLLNWQSLYAAFGTSPSGRYVTLFIITVFLRKAAFFFGPVVAGVSRRFERQADLFAAQLASPGALIEALKKLALNNLSNLHPHVAYAWFYYSHPPVTDRIADLKGISGGLK
jgi:STE24 endopeptidase